MEGEHTDDAPGASAVVLRAGARMTVATSRSAREPLALAELPAPPLGPRDVRVRVRAIGVNPVDWKIRAGGELRLVRAMGARVAGVCSARNVPLVERLGAVALDYTRGDALQAARAHGPFHLVLHAVGTATYPLAACRALLAPRGVVALVVVRG